MSEQRITCQECGGVFAFSEAEQAFYSEKGLASPPKRCKACRQARKAARGGGGGGGAGPRRYSGDVNEYRSPMSGGNAGQEWARGGDRPRQHNGGRPNGNRWNGGAGGAQARGNGYAHGPGYGSGGGGAGGAARDGNGYRSPAFPESRHGGGGGQSAARAPRSGPSGPPKTPKQPRPERPKYDITCVECGAAAQVPFKPLEGRQVFCQDCYRARRAAPRDGVAVTADVAGGTDTGIVE